MNILKELFGLNPKKPQKMTLSEFMEKHSMRFKKVVESCTNEAELQVAENYIRSGLRTYVNDPDSDNANEYVRLLIRPKILEFKAIYNS